jgi:hypothetical protein
MAPTAQAPNRRPPAPYRRRIRGRQRRAHRQRWLSPLFSSHSRALSFLLTLPGPRQGVGLRPRKPVLPLQQLKQSHYPVSDATPLWWSSTPVSTARYTVNPASLKDPSGMTGRSRTCAWSELGASNDSRRAAALSGERCDTRTVLVMFGVGGIALGAAPIAGGLLLGAAAGNINRPDPRAGIKRIWSCWSAYRSSRWTAGRR